MTMKTEQKVGWTVAKLTTVAIAMFAFVFVVMVPLYDVLCDALGINGKTGGRYEATSASVDETRTIEIQFVSNFNEGMPWEFKPSVTAMKVHPGASNDTVYLAKNPLNQDMVAQAVPSISPARAAAYFHKTECFCFNQQPLAAGEQAELALQFIVDKDLPRDIKTITLSYTIFDITNEAFAKPAVASR